MKFVAILSLVLVLVSGQTCPVYVCDTDAKNYPSGVCAMQNTKNTNEYDMNPNACTSSQYCPYDATKSTVACIDKPAPTSVTNIYPGEKCDSSHQCATGTCGTGGTCPTLAKSAECINVQDCGGSLTCPKYGTTALTCTPLAAAGEACYLNSDCVQSAGCVGASTTANPPTAGKCVTYMSIAAGHDAQGCTAAENAIQLNIYCASGYCFTNSTASYCTDSLENSESNPYECSSGTASCTSKKDSISEMTFSQNCECGLNGKFYCPLFNGDSDAKPYYSYLQSTLAANWITACNTINNGGSPIDYVKTWCGQSTSGASQKDIYYYYRAQSYAQYVKADKCVLEALAPFYDVSEGSGWLLLSSLALAFIN